MKFEDEEDVPYREYKIWTFENNFYIRSSDSKVPMILYDNINNLEFAKFVIDLLYENKELKNKIEEIK